MAENYGRPLKDEQRGAENEQISSICVALSPRLFANELMKIREHKMAFHQLLSLKEAWICIFVELIKCYLRLLNCLNGLILFAANLISKVCVSVCTV